MQAMFGTDRLLPWTDSVHPLRPAPVLLMLAWDVRKTPALADRADDPRRPMFIVQHHAIWGGLVVYLIYL